MRGGIERGGRSGRERLRWRGKERWREERKESEVQGRRKVGMEEVEVEDSKGRGQVWSWTPNMDVW